MNEEALFVALYLDADVDRKLADRMRAEGFEAVSAREVDNDELSDEDQLAYAAAQKRALLTHNTRHFVPLFKEWWFANKGALRHHRI